jgi:hypothetical protein
VCHVNTLIKSFIFIIYFIQRVSNSTYKVSNYQQRPKPVKGKTLSRSSSMKSPDIERLLDTLGQPGRLQSISCFCLCVNLWVVMTNHMSSVFFAARTEYSCRLNKNTSSHVLPLLTRNGQAKTDECSILINNNTEKCTVWDYHLPDGETTIISEVFRIICMKASVVLICNLIVNNGGLDPHFSSGPIL